MTKREVLTSIVSAYIQGTGKFPALSEKGDLNPAWYKTVEAICNKYPEKDFLDSAPCVDTSHKFENPSTSYAY